MAKTASEQRFDFGTGLVSKSAEETKEAGQRLAADLIDKSANNDGNAIALSLIGDLGSGKTTFTQGLAKGLGIDSQVISPSYILMRKYDISSKKQVASKDNTLRYFYHVDLYRLEDNVWSEVKNLGIEEVWSDPENMVVIEWADKIKDKLPDYAREIRFEYLGEEKRRIVVN